MSKLEGTKKQIDEITGIMRANLEKVLERDTMLSNLEDKSENLKDGANRFETTARKLKHKFWWKNLKFTIGIGVVIMVFILVIILIIRPWKN
jgi:hypothetical protein